jgi:hypothetical protein
MSAREEAAFKAAADHELGLRRTEKGWVATDRSNLRTIGAEATSPVAALENAKQAIEDEAARKVNDAASRLQEALAHGRFYILPTDGPGGDVSWAVLARGGQEVQGGMGSWLEAARLVAELDAAEVTREKGLGNPPPRPGV